MRRHLAIAVAAGLIWAANTGNLQAQSTQIGSYAAYQFDVKDPGMGGHLSVPLARTVDLYPSATYYFVETGSMWAVNADLRYRMPRLLYVGAGLNVSRQSSFNTNNTDAGFNMLGGVEARTGKVRPFAEARVVLNSGSSFQLNGGVNMSLR